ncbi:MAG: hypothetical protein V1829_00890 [bacterium]
MFTFNLILYFLIGFSLFILVIIVYRKIPNLVDLSEEEMTIIGRKKGIIQHIKGINYKHHWLNFILFLEKFLRKTKIIFLKIENVLSKWIIILRGKSQIMTQKSREWIKQMEISRRKKEERERIKKNLIVKTEEKISVETDSQIIEPQIKSELEPEQEPEIDEDELPISELKKPIKEEQKWIDLIVENPKNITAYKFLGLLYWKQHNYADAKASLEMSVRLGSKDRKVKEILKELESMNIE